MKRRGAGADKGIGARVARVLAALATVDRRTLFAGGASLVVVAAALFASCRRGGGEGAPAASASASSRRVTGADAGLAVLDVPPEDLWKLAEGGDEEDLARLADREGATGLVEGGKQATSPARKQTAIRALAYSDGFVGLPWLVDAADADGDDAKLAVASIDALAARPRTAEDNEDAPELRAGCDHLLALAKNTARARPVRVGAVRALRMWSDRGCAKPEEIPTDVDAH